MASKRFVKSGIDWAAFAERIFPQEKAKFQQFKAKADNYMKNVMSLPEKPPAIDFAAYRSRLPNQAMVNEFEKQYNALKVPFPEDKLTCQVDEQEKLVMEQIRMYKELSDLHCKVMEKNAQWWKDMIPFAEMTMDDYHDYFPNNPHNIAQNPNSFWPHDEPPKPIFPYLDKKQHH